jgi:hypothetical protein
MSAKTPYAALGESDTAAYHDEARLGLIEAQLACLYRRQAGAADSAVALDVAWQIRDAIVARRALLRARGEPADA